MRERPALDAEKPQPKEPSRDRIRANFEGRVLIGEPKISDRQEETLVEADGFSRWILSVGCDSFEVVGALEGERKARP